MDHVAPHAWLAHSASPGEPADAREIAVRPLLGGVAAYWAIVIAIDFVNDWALLGVTIAWPPLQQVVLNLVIWWGIWLAFTPAVIALAVRLAPGRIGWRRSAVWHLALSIGLGLLHCALAAAMFALRTDTAPTGAIARAFIAQFTLGQCLTYFGLIAVVYGSHFWRVARMEGVRSSSLEQRTSHLERVSGEARMRALRHQLDTHLLLNGLHSVGALVREEDRPAALGLLEELGGLVRSISDLHAAQIPLCQELELLERYVGVARLRHRDRLAVRYDIEAGVETALVPPLVLQPIVENALVHGGPDIVIGARSAGDKLVLDVRDRGGAGHRPALAEGIGLANTRARLALLHGDAATLALEHLDDGASCIIELPLERAHD